MAHDPTSPLHVGTQFTDLNAAMQSHEGSGFDLDRVVRFAVESVPGTGHCAVTLLQPGRRPRTLSATDETPLEVDRIQYDVGEGPCLTASEGGMIEVSGSLDTDARWPTFGPRCVAETGVVSMLSVRLELAEDDQAAMNFYSRSRHQFGDRDVASVSVFAPFAALAVEHALREREAKDFQSALASSRQIGIAIGVLMAQHRLTSGQAFDLLRRTSQNLNRKVRDVATEIEHTGDLPDSPSSWGESGSGPDSHRRTQRSG